jgi:hypothetical protein
VVIFASQLTAGSPFDGFDRPAHVPRKVLDARVPAGTLFHVGAGAIVICEYVDPGLAKPCSGLNVPATPLVSARATVRHHRLEAGTCAREFSATTPMCAS